MIETKKTNQRNRVASIVVASVVALVSFGLTFLTPMAWAGLLVAPLVYYWMRRRTIRRLQVLAGPLDRDVETALIRHVAFYQALDSSGKKRFQDLVKVFLDEVPITGIKTDVDATTRALVAASAAIPIFGFDDWEYSGLGEVLIYPNAFGENFSFQGDGDTVERRTLGMVGVGNLSGVMILSKPDLIAGFANPEDKRNVGIHEFAHLVDKADGAIDGLPPGASVSTVGPWIQWVGQELQNQPQGRHHIDDYAYTNEAEYFAVLSEYFFEAPDTLQQKAPKIYDMMQSMYRQNTRSFLSTVTKRRKRVGRNSKCPCGSGEKFKNCCGRRR